MYNRPVVLPRKRHANGDTDDLRRERVLLRIHRAIEAHTGVTRRAYRSDGLGIGVPLRSVFRRRGGASNRSNSPFSPKVQTWSALRAGDADAEKSSPVLTEP